LGGASTRRATQFRKALCTDLTIVSVVIAPLASIVYTFSASDIVESAMLRSALL
jgi:hypothetical protein